MKQHILAVLAAVVLTVGGARAQEPQPPQPLSRADLDKRAKKVAYDIVDRGVSLFNSGEKSPNPQVQYEGTARLYEGGLRALLEMLDHRPDVVKTINLKLEVATTLAKPQDRAFALREALDEVMKIGAKKAPLWERLGGEKAVAAVVKDFVATTAANPKVNFTRNGKYKPDAKGVERIEKTLVELISETTGGPLKYSGKNMKELHAGMKITEAEFGAMAEDLVATLQKYKVPKAEIDELIKIVASTKPDIVEVK